INTIAGSGSGGYSGDGGPATGAQISQPFGVEVDGAGNVYIADRNNCRIREVTGGTINTAAGNGTCGFSGDGGAATAALLDLPEAVASDAAGNVYIADTDNHRIRKIAVAADSDLDRCLDARELGPSHTTGGQRDPSNGNDFFDTPTPVLLPSNTTGTRNKAITIGDVIAIVAYIGTSSAMPGTPNSNGATHGSDWNVNGTPDGQEYDRTAGGIAGQPWRSGAPNGAVSIADALVDLNQVGDNCN